MSKSLSSALGLDMTEVAQLLRKSGRGKDTVLAHITPKEAALLKRRGGRGSINPKTGLPEFDDSPNVDFTSLDTSFSSPSFDAGGGVPTVDLTQQQSVPFQDLNAGASGQSWGPTSPFAGSYDPVTQPIDTSIQQPNLSSQATGEGAFDPNAGAGQAASGTFPPPQDPAAAQQGAPAKQDNGWMSQLAAALGTTVAGLTKAGVLGGTAALGAAQGQKSAAQGQAAADSIGALAPQAVQQGNVASTALANLAAATAKAGNTTAQTIQAVGQPIKDVGTQMIQNAQGGALTPADLQALDILRARGLQDMSGRGGVGAMQEGVTEANARSTMGQNELNQGVATYNQGAQYDMAAAQVELAQQNLASQYYSSAISTTLAQANISDQYTVNAIMLALQNDQVTAQNLQKLYASLASIAFGGGGGNGSVTINTTAPATI